MDDAGEWNISPSYDVTFSAAPFGEHSTAFADYGKAPPLKTMQHLADQANFKNWAEAKQVILSVLEAINHWENIAIE